MTKKVLRVQAADPSGDWAAGGEAAGTAAGTILGEKFGPSGQWFIGGVLGAAGEIAGGLAGQAYGAAGAAAGAIYGGAKGLVESTLHPVEFGTGEGDPGAGMSGPQGGTSVDPNANERLQSGGE